MNAAGGKCVESVEIVIAVDLALLPVQHGRYN
jgi:hypothetical protein